MIDGAVHVLGREWGNLRRSFEMCGDVGDFNLEEFNNLSKWFVGGEEGFISNVVNMDSKLSKHGYATPEALNVFTVLASVAANKLGLAGELASAFGAGYGFVRTGLLAYYTLDPRHVLFNKMFFPFGGVTFHWDFNCDVHPSLVKAKLKFVFERFRSWQNDPQLYAEDFAQFQNIGEVWEAWEEA